MREVPVMIESCCEFNYSTVTKGLRVCFECERNLYPHREAKGLLFSMRALSFSQVELTDSLSLWW